MGVSEAARQAVDQHRTAVEDVVQALLELAADLDVCRRQLAGDGPIGISADPDLDRARHGLQTARRALAEAADRARASADPAQRYVQRVFPS